MGLLKAAGIDKYLKKIKKYIDDGLSKKLNRTEIKPTTFEFDLAFVYKNSTDSGSSTGALYVTHEIIQQAGFTDEVIRRLWDSRMPICMDVGYSYGYRQFLPIRFWTYSSDFTEEDAEAGYTETDGLAVASFGYIDMNENFGTSVDIQWDFDMHLWIVTINEI